MKQLEVSLFLKSTRHQPTKAHDKGSLIGAVVLLPPPELESNRCTNLPNHCVPSCCPPSLAFCAE